MPTFLQSPTFTYLTKKACLWKIRSGSLLKLWSSYDPKGWLQTWASNTPNKFPTSFQVLTQPINRRATLQKLEQKSVWLIDWLMKWHVILIFLPQGISNQFINYVNWMDFWSVILILVDQLYINQRDFWTISRNMINWSTNELKSILVFQLK